MRIPREPRGTDHSPQCDPQLSAQCSRLDTDRSRPMQLQHWFALTLALTPSLASAALFSKDSLVKQLDPKGFRKVMKENVRALVQLLSSTFYAAVREHAARRAVNCDRVLAVTLLQKRP